MHHRDTISENMEKITQMLEQAENREFELEKQQKLIDDDRELCEESLEALLAREGISKSDPKVVELSSGLDRIATLQDQIQGQMNKMDSDKLRLERKVCCSPKLSFTTESHPCSSMQFEAAMARYEDLESTIVTLRESRQEDDVARAEAALSRAKAPTDGAML